MIEFVVRESQHLGEPPMAILGPMPELTAIYTRISEDRQEGAGVLDQYKDCCELAQRNGWTALAHFEDNDISASQYARERRPRYREMLARVRAGEVRRIVVAHLDRLYRQPKELEELIDLADQGRVDILSVYSGPLDLSTGDGRAMARILVAIAAKSSDDTSRRVARAKRRAREAGEPTGGPRPFGWLKVTTTDADGSVRETWDPMTQDPREAALIREAAADIIAGTSLADIARRWNAAKVLQPQGRRDRRTNPNADNTIPRWQPTMVRGVLTSPRNAGLVPHYRDTRGVDGKVRKVVDFEGTAKWSAIVDRATWERCREILESRSVRWSQPRRRSLLTGLVICGRCGATMVRSAYTGTGSPAWRCPSHPGKVGSDGKPSCGRVYVGAAALEEDIVEAMFKWADTTKLARLVRTRTADEEKAASLSARLADVERRLNEAADSYASGRLSLHSYERLTIRLEGQERQIRAQVSRLGSSSPLDRYVGRPGALRAEWDNLSLDEKRAALKESVGPVAILPAIRPGRPFFDKDRVVAANGFVPVRARGS